MTPFLTMLAALERAAHESAFGRNALPTPTEAQCKAGNYRVGRVNIHGLPISIEQPRDSVRCGTDPSGKAWRSRMAAHYGYINGTKGADGDPVDCFIGDWPISDTVWVINQHIGGRFDEHKVMLLFNREDMARAAYLDSYEPGWNGIGSMLKLTPAQLAWWLKTGDMSKPLTPDQLFNEGFHPMNTPDPTWDSGAHVARAWYDVSRMATGMDAHELEEPLNIRDAMDGGQLLPTFDALVVTMGKAQAKLAQMQSVLARNGGTLSAVGMQITDPFRQAGTTNIVAIYELSDGQTISIYLHNPDTTPNKLAPTDAMVAWKWLLNRRDVTVVVAPENGQELSPLVIGRRVMALAEKNSAAFVKANARRAEKLQSLDALVGEVADLTTRKRLLENELSTLDVEIVDAVAQKQAQARGARKTRASQVVAPVQASDEQTQAQQGDAAPAASVEPLPFHKMTIEQQRAVMAAEKSAVSDEKVDLFLSDWSRLTTGYMTAGYRVVGRIVGGPPEAFSMEAGDIKTVSPDGMLATDATADQANELRDAVRGGQVQVELYRRWGGSVDSATPIKVLHQATGKFKPFEGTFELPGTLSGEAPSTDPQATADRALFQSIIDGTAPDLLSPELADQFGAAGERRADDPDMKVLFEQAVNVYQEAMLAATADMAA